MKYLLIDRERMAVVHAHSDDKVLYQLQFIEVSHVDSVVLPCTDNAMAVFTDLELNMLYTSVCGQRFPGFARAALVHGCQSAALTIPESEVNSKEVLAQSLCIKDNDGSYYKYTPGSLKPTKMAEVWHCAARHTIAGYVPPVPPAPAMQAPAMQAPPAPASQPRAPRAPSEPGEAPKVGSVRDRIWAMADQMWAEAGSPVDLKLVLQLRKKMMTCLEEVGVKRNTSSNELGVWQKSRVIA